MGGEILTDGRPEGKENRLGPEGRPLRLRRGPPTFTFASPSSSPSLFLSLRLIFSYEAPFSRSRHAAVPG